MLKLFNPRTQINRAHAIAHNSLEKRCSSAQEVRDNGHVCFKSQENPDPWINAAEDGMCFLLRITVISWPNSAVETSNAIDYR